MPHEFPQTVEQLLTEAIKRDVSQRLEQAMHEDAEIAAFLETAGATVIVDVVIDRELGEGRLAFAPEPRADQSFGGAIGLPSVIAMLDLIRRRVRDGEAARRYQRNEPFCFEIAIRPDRVLPLGA